MNRIIITLSALLLLMAANLAFGQTACTSTNPCVAVQVTAANWTTGMTTTLYGCQGSASSCSAAALAAFIAAPNTSSPWEVKGTFPQTAATTVFNDPEPYGALMNYAAANTPQGGVQGPVSGILTFSMPQAPPLKAPSMGAGGMKTSGTVGPQ